MRTQGAKQLATAAGLGNWVPQVATVPYLNALPLIDGLVAGGQVRMVRAVPSKLAAMLQRGRIDAALLPTIDLPRMAATPLVLTAGCIASDGPTETVCIFSRVPPATIRQLYVDIDSHSSVALAAVLWAESFNKRLEMVPLRAGRTLREHPPEAVLVIGDKVATWPAAAYPWRIDLGAAWRELTHLPFVFAIWAMRSISKSPGRQAAALHHLLVEARVRGMSKIDEIALRYGAKLGWSTAAAATYLTENIQYKFTPRHREGLDMFFRLAHKHKLITEIKPLSYVEAT